MDRVYDYDRILQGILDVGEEMVCCGAEVSRVEDSICLLYTSSEEFLEDGIPHVEMVWKP